MSDEIAWLKDAGDAEDPCYVPAAKGDRGAFPVYGEPHHDALFDALALVRMSMGWQYLADETKAIIDAALEEAK